MRIARRLPLIIVTILGIVSIGVAAQPTILEAPTYIVGNRWEYRLEGRIAALEGLGNLTGLLEVDGSSTGRVTSVDGGKVTILWQSDMTVSGSLLIPGEEGDLEASVQGSIEASRTEQFENSYFLPVEVTETTEFDLTVTVGFSVSYAASIQATAAVTPGLSYPDYPLEEGDLEFEAPVRIESNVTASLFGVELVNESREDVTSRIRLEVSSPLEVIVPAGSFQAVRVGTEIVAGVGLGPFAILFPGATQVAFHSEVVGNAVLLQFLGDGNETELGKAALRSFTYSTSQPPLWQQPLFVGGVLAVPVALLLYFYWRERRKGL